MNIIKATQGEESTVLSLEIPRILRDTFRRHPVSNMREAGYSRTAPILINWSGEPSEYAEHPDNWIFL
jgi:hypothetical protein